MAKKLTVVTARVFCASLMVLAALPVLGQAEQEQATPAPEAGRWVGLVIVLVLFAGVCLGCFTTPKRSHQD